MNIYTIMRLWGVYIIAIMLFCCCLGDNGGMEGEDEKISQDEDEFIRQYLDRQSQKDRYPEGASGEDISVDGAYKEENKTSGITLRQCHTECCILDDTIQRPCPGDLECVNGFCQDPECPFECCVLGRYTPRECQAGMECVDYECIKTPCPANLQCCDQRYHTSGKCPGGFECVDSVCFPINEKTGHQEPVKVYADLGVGFAAGIWLNHSAVDAIKKSVNFGQDTVDEFIVIARAESWISVENIGDGVSLNHSIISRLYISCERLKIEIDEGEEGFSTVSLKEKRDYYGRPLLPGQRYMKRIVMTLMLSDISEEGLEHLISNRPCELEFMAHALNHNT